MSQQLWRGFALSLVALCAASPGAEAERRPNILFILTDDQRWDCMSAAGHPYLETPHMDRLAREGVHFTNAFVTTSLCSPSRASFLTGKHTRVHGVTNNNYEMNFERHPTFPEYLQKAGYDTAYVGKWHMGWSDRRRPGYNTWISYPGQGVYFNQEFTYNDVRIATTGYNSDVTTDFALGWLRQKRSQPFMLCLSFKAPHEPWKPPPRNEGLYADKEWPLPPSIWASRDGKPEHVRSRGPQPPPRSPDRRNERIQNFVRQFSECVKGIDDNLGRVWEVLEELGEMDNTLIIFAGDNGYFFGEFRLGDKRGMYDPSIRIPLLMRYPKWVPAGKRIDALVLNIDVAPTVLEAAGLEVPAAMQGGSLAPLVQGKEVRWRDAFLYEYLHEEPYRYPTVYGVRTHKWAYMHHPDLEGQDELYDMVSDPDQIQNVIQDPAYASDLAAMKARLAELEREAGERAPPNTVPDTGPERAGRSITVPDR